MKLKTKKDVIIAEIMGRIESGFGFIATQSKQDRMEKEKDWFAMKIDELETAIKDEFAEQTLEKLKSE